MPFCEFCKQLQNKVVDATAKCLDCDKPLCTECTDTHRKTKITLGHSVCDTDTEKAIECSAHGDEKVKYYCERCDVLVCVLCTFQDHASHDVSNFKDGVEKYRRRLEQVLSVCQDRLEELRQQLSAIHECSSKLHDTEDHIRTHAKDAVARIRTEERDLVQKLHDLYGDDTVMFLGTQTQIKDTYDHLLKNCKLAQSLKEKEIEFLLIRKELEQKLQDLMDHDIKPTPKNISKKFDFIEGKSSLGKIRNLYESDSEDDLSDTKLDGDRKPIGTKRKPQAPSSVEKLNNVTDSSVGTETNQMESRGVQTTGSRKSVSFQSKKKVNEMPTSRAVQTCAVEQNDQFTQLPDETQQKITLGDNQGLAILPNRDLVVIDAEDNKMAILDKRGRFRYTFAAEQLTYPKELLKGNIRDYVKNGERVIKIYTPHGYILHSKDNEIITCLPLGCKLEPMKLFK